MSFDIAGEGSSTKKIKKYSDEELYSGLDISSPGSTVEQKEQNGEVIKPKQNTRKLSTDDGTAQIWVEDDTVSITRGEVGLQVNKDCVIISGRVGITTDIEKTRVQGFWTYNPELLTCLPSTLYTPIPVLLYTDPPYAKRAGALLGLVTGTG